MREKTSFWSMVIAAWQSIMSYGIGISAVAAILLYRLGTLVPGLSDIEVLSQKASQNLGLILENPVYLPHKIIQFGVQSLGGNNAFNLRLASVLLGAGFVLLFYYTVRSWHTRRVALLATTLLATSSWFLHNARMASSGVLLLGLLLALAYGSWLQRTKKSALVILIGSLVVGTLIYIPGFIWVVVLAMIWQYQRLFKLIKAAPIAAILGLLLVIIWAAPLAYAISKQPELARYILGLPINHNELGLTQIATNLISIPAQMVFRGPADPVMWLGRLPFLDYLTLALAILGSYAYFFKRQLDRTKAIVGCLVAGVLLVAIGGIERIAILMPIIYLLAAGGLSLMLQRWFTVFPRNPLARNIGVALLAIAVLSSSYYNLSHYFVAWPQTSETKSVFQIRL